VCLIAWKNNLPLTKANTRRQRNALRASRKR
jgi:hypothetical protein